MPRNTNATTADDWFTQNAPVTLPSSTTPGIYRGNDTAVTRPGTGAATPPPSVPGPTWAQVMEAYQRWLHRAPSQAEYERYWKNTPNYNQAIAFSAEAKRYRQTNNEPEPTVTRNDDGTMTFSDPSLAPTGAAAGKTPTGQATPTPEYLLSLIKSGLTPQAAIAKFNQETGRTSGNEAVYYGPEVHGTATIGLPGHYLSLESGGWAITARSPEGAKTTPPPGGPTGPTTTGGRAAFVPLDASLSGNYDQALAVIQQRAKEYGLPPLTAADIAAIKAKYGDGEAGTTTTTPGTRATATRLDPGMSGSSDQAIAYLNKEAQRLLGRPLTAAEIQQGASLVGYKQGAPVTGAQVNTILGEIDKLVPAGPGTTTTTPGKAHVYTAGDLNPILQDLYNQAGGKTTTTTGGGTTGTSNINPGTGYGALLLPWTVPFEFPEFQGPTAETFKADPGYGFRTDQGQQGIERSAASKGTLLTGGTLKDIENYRQGAASSEFSNVWGRAFTEWQQKYAKARGEYDTNYNIFTANQDRPFNKLSSLAGTGQVASGQLNSAGSNFAANAGNILTGTAAAQGNFATQGANASAAGMVGGANAWMNSLGNIGNDATTLAFLNRASAYGK